MAWSTIHDFQIILSETWLRNGLIEKFIPGVISASWLTLIMSQMRDNRLGVMCRNER